MNWDNYVVVDWVIVYVLGIGVWVFDFEISLFYYYNIGGILFVVVIVFGFVVYLCGIVFDSFIMVVVVKCEIFWFVYVWRWMLNKLVVVCWECWVIWNG